MKLSIGVQRFTIKPENSVDRAYLELLRQETDTITFEWDDWEVAEPDSSSRTMPVLIITFNTKTEKLEESK